MATIRWCPIFPKWDIYQPLLTDNLFRNVKAGGVWLLALLSKTGMEKRARNDAMARELQLHGLTIFRWEVENAEMSYNIFQFDPILVTQPFSQSPGIATPRFACDWNV